MDAKDLTPEQILARIRAQLEGQHQHAVPQGEPLMAAASPTQGVPSLAADIAADLELIARKKFPGYIQPGSRFAPLKKLIRRLILVYTREQMEYNDAVLRVLGSLAKSVHQLQSPGTIARLAAQANYPSDEFYFEFEQAFRGSDEVKWESWKHYAALVADHCAAHQAEFNKAYHLDVGCGRGEFLQHLKSRDIPARGVDSNEVMVTHCHELDLEVTKADALAYLAELEENSLLGISAFQFIEHLYLRDLCDFLALSHRTLRPKGLLILETVNPESVYALRWFFMDFMHNKPLFADMIRFMLTKTGFRDIDVRLTSPVESWKQLGVVGHQKADENFHKLNNLVFGYQDYAVMARK